MIDVVLVVGRAGLGDWARAGLSAARALAARDRAFRLALVLLPGAPGPADPGLAYLATHPWVDLRAGTSDPLAADDLVRALRGADVVAGLPVADGDCPYRGLEAFREDDTDLFFGREQDTARLIGSLRSTRFVAVLGPSGSGKSSLVQAGLLPAVGAGAIPGSEAWRVIALIPGKHPLASLAAQLAQLPGAGAPSAADLAADPRSLDLAVERALEGRPAAERALVVVDQLEEAFMLCSDEGARAAFLSSLAYAATIPGGRAVVVLVMRADFYHRLAEHHELRSLVAAQQYLVGPMDARGLRRAIEEPARRAGLALEPGLTRRILTDVSDRPGTLPLLEHLLLELWQRRRGRILTLEAYAASGGVEGAVARRANEIYGGMSPERQAIARRVLLRLTQPGEGTEDTRRRAERRELATGPNEEAEVEAVVAALAQARLVTTSRDEVSGETVVEVTHEALLRGWPELRGWIDDDRERLRQQRRLSEAGVEWDAGGRDDGLLYRGARLAFWQERERSDLNERERAFLAASHSREERVHRARRRRMRMAVGALGGVATLVAGLAIFAVIQRGDATDQRDLALSRQVAAGARARITADPEQSLLLARDAYRIAPTSQAEEALRLAATESRVRFAYGGHEGPVRGLAVTGDGTTVASVGDDGTIQLWSPAQPSEPPRTLRGHEGPVQSVAFSADGRILVSGGSDGTVRTWSTAEGAGRRVLEAGRAPVRSVATSADGAVIAAGGDDGRLRVWRDDTEPVVMPGPMAQVTGVALSENGSVVAAGGGERSLGVGITRVWDAVAATQIRSDEPYTGFVTGVALRADGRTVFGVSLDNTVRQFAVSGAGAPIVLDALGTGLTSIAVEGDRIVTGALDGSAIVWEAAGRRIVDLPGHQGTVNAVAFVPGSPLVLSAGEDGVIRGSDWRSADPPHLPADDVATGRIDPAAGAVELVTIPGGIERWDPATGARSALAAPPPDGINWVAIDPAGDVARNLPDGTITITRRDRRPIAPIRGLPADAFQLALSRDASWLVIADTAGNVFAWDLRGAAPRRILAGRADPNSIVAISETGAVAARIGAQVRLWSAPRAEARTFAAGDQTVKALAFTPDGQNLAVGATDGTVRVWPVVDGSSVALLRHPGGIQGLEFGRDGRLLAVAATDEAVVWDWRRQIAAARWDDPGVLEAHLDPQGRRILTVAQGGMRLHSCDACGPVDEVLDMAANRVSRPLTDDERREFAPGS